MNYEYYGHIGKYTDLDNKDRLIYRLLEIFPGLLAWLTLVFVVFISFKFPTFAAIFIILFDTYWFIKTLYLSFHLRSTFNQVRKNLKKDWTNELDLINPENINVPGVKEWHDIYHLIILPTYKESVEVVAGSLESILRSNYPDNRIIVVVGQEDLAGREHNEKVRTFIEKEYGDKFLKLIITDHPGNIPGELKGKGSNASYAGRKGKQIIDELGLPYTHVIVSNFDIDTIVPVHFFGYLTYLYLTSEKPLRSSFQPVPLFTNNIWEAPAFARVFAFSTTFWQMIQQARPEQLVTFSSQSIGFQALVDIGFWQKNMVSEDSRVFWQCFLRYDGDWKTVPMNYPVYMDANVGPTFWKTIKNQYKQIRRWHFGVENNPYFMFGFLKNKDIPLFKKLLFTWTMGEKTHSSSTNALIIFLLGWLPVFVGGNIFNQSVLSLNLPVFTRNIMFLSMIGLVTSAIISVIFLPPRPMIYGRLKWVWMTLQWILFPINFIFFGAIPALEAQTRLMFGNYLGFWPTPKIRGAILESYQKNPNI